MPESLPGRFAPAKMLALLAQHGMTPAGFDRESGLCTPVQVWLSGKAVPTSALIGYFAVRIGCAPADLTDPDGPDAIAAEDARLSGIVTAGPGLDTAQRTTMRRMLALAGTAMR
jgi:hypothetical protein